MPTIKDVAKLASVSTATVSAAINGTNYVSPLLKERIDKAIRDLSYTPDGIARSLKKGRTRLIGLVVDDVTSPFYTELIELVEAAAYAEGYSLLLCHTGQDIAKEEKYLRIIRTHRVDGIIWAPTGPSNEYNSPAFSRFATPIVFVDRAISTLGQYDSVVLDNHAAGEQATNYLLDLGHRRIALITGADHLVPAHDRMEGYRSSLTRRGIAFDPALVRNGNFREAEAFEECRKLLDGHARITALLVANNHMLIGALRAINQHGLTCPRDISIVAIDDFPLASVMSPRLTTVSQPVKEIADQALRILLRRLVDEGADNPFHCVVEPTLIVRDSCSPIVPVPG